MEKARLIFLSTSPEADAIWIIAIRMEYSLKTKEEAEKKSCRIKKAVKPSFTAFCKSNVRGNARRSQHAIGSHVAIMPVTALHGRDRDALAARSTDEVTVTEIEPGMRDAFSIGLEVDKIPGL